MEIVKQLRSFFSPELRVSSAILAVLFSLPFGWHVATNVGLLLVLLISFTSLTRNDWRQPFKSPIFWASAGFFLFALLSISWAENKSDGFTQLETKLSFFFGPLLFVALKRKYPSNFKDVVLKTMVLSNVAVGVLALGIAAFKSINAGSLYYMASNGVTKIFYFTYVELASPFMHPGYLSTYMGIAVLIGLYYFFSLKSSRKYLYLGAAAFLFMLLFMLQGRINIIALFAVLGVSALAAAIKLKMYKLLVLPVIPVMLLIGFLLFGSVEVKERYFQLPDFKYDISGNQFNSATYRLAEWSCAIDAIKEHVLFGSGLGDNRDLLQETYKKRGFNAGFESHFNAHNQYLETAISTGLIGLGLLLMLLGVYGFIAWRNSDYLTLACLAFFALSMLTESMFERAWAVMLFASYFPISLLLATNKSE